MAGEPGVIQFLLRGIFTAFMCSLIATTYPADFFRESSKKTVYVVFLLFGLMYVGLFAYSIYKTEGVTFMVTIIVIMMPIPAVPAYKYTVE